MIKSRKSVKRKITREYKLRKSEINIEMEKESNNKTLGEYFNKLQFAMF